MTDSPRKVHEVWEHRKIEGFETHDESSSLSLARKRKSPKVPYFQCFRGFLFFVVDDFLTTYLCGLQRTSVLHRPRNRPRRWERVRTLSRCQKMDFMILDADFSTLPAMLSRYRLLKTKSDFQPPRDITSDSGSPRVLANDAK